MPKGNRSSFRPGRRPSLAPAYVVTVVLLFVAPTREAICLTAVLSPLSLLQVTSHEWGRGRVNRSFYIFIFL